MKTLRGVVALSATVVLLAGCGGDAEPKFEAEPSPSPTSTTPGPDELEPWEEKTPDGAIAFAKHWTSTFSDAFQTGDTETLVKLSADDCTGCNGFIKLIREVYDGGGSISGPPWKLLEAGWSAPNDDESVVAVTGTMRIPRQTIRRAGQRPSKAEPTAETYFFTLSWHQGQWVTTQLARQA